MSERCTCGAQLLPESRFCHKCGKPQGEQLPVEEEVVIAPPPLPVQAAAPPPPEIGFHNALAVRIGLMLAIAAFILSVVIKPLLLLWMLIAGVGAAWLYARRTGVALTAVGGARLGWITGLFLFLILMILVSGMALAMTDKSVADTVMAQMKQSGAEEQARAAIQALQNPGELAEVLAKFFVVCGLLPVVGGVLGARLFRKAGTAS